MNAAKIRLSSKEMELVTNADWILTKNGILQKTKELLETVLQEQQIIAATYKTRLPAEIFQVSPKISKGENYKGLPYLVLDFPRHFDKENIFAIRTMFWWGNFFSMTLHLSGSYKQQFEEKIFASFSVLREQEFFLCTNDDEWEHHFEPDNYLSLEDMSQKQLPAHTRQKRFLKLARKIPVEKWSEAAVLLPLQFNGLLRLLTG